MVAKVRDDSPQVKSARPGVISALELRGALPVDGQSARKVGHGDGRMIKFNLMVAADCDLKSDACVDRVYEGVSA